MCRPDPRAKGLPKRSRRVTNPTKHSSTNRPSFLGNSVASVIPRDDRSVRQCPYFLPLPPHPALQVSFPHSDMSDQLQLSSRFRVLFESALQDYQIQTGTTLASHPLAEKLQNCNSVESVTALLQDQARTFTEFRGDNGRITKSLKGVVSVLYTLSTSTASIGLVRRKASMGIPYL